MDGDGEQRRFACLYWIQKVEMKKNSNWINTFSDPMTIHEKKN